MATTSSPPPPTVAERLVACRSLLTSLPYVDDDLLSVPDVQRRVEALIREEMGRFSPPDYLAAPHPSAAATRGLERRAGGTAGSSSGAGAAAGVGAAGAAEEEEAAGAGAAEAGGGGRSGSGVSVFLAEELERVAAGRGMVGLDQERYRLPRPADAQQADAGAWRDALRNAQAQLQHQDTRLVNLELMKTFGVRAWRAHGEAQAQLTAAAEARRDAARAAAEGLNVRRRTVQERHADKLVRLGRKRHELVYTNARLEVATAALEGEVKRLRSAATARGVGGGGGGGGGGDAAAAGAAAMEEVE
jgi:hypothetical protein